MVRRGADGTCDVHRGRDARGVCVTCHRAGCADCLVTTRVGIKCRECAGGDRRDGDGPRRWRWAVLPAVSLVALLGGAWVLWGPGPAEAPTGTGGTPATVRFEGAGGVLLTGALDLPEAGREPAPGVLVVPGFGAAGRVGVGGADGAADPLYRDLGGALADAGFVVLRYDKRGAGQSASSPRASTPGLGDRVGDAAAALALLRGRREVDPDRVAVVGHGEGGLVAMRLAGGDRTPAATVLINTWGRPLVDVLATEFVRGLPPGDERDLHQRLADTLRAHVATLLETGRAPDPRELPAALRPVFPPGMDAYLRELFALDPAALAADVSGPVLLVHGELDPCVRPQDIRRLRSALAGPVEVHRRPEAGHTLLLGRPAGHADQHGPDGEGMSHERAGRRDRAALRGIGDWLAERLEGDVDGRR